MIKFIEIFNQPIAKEKIIKWECNFIPPELLNNVRF
jgi:hypothetical protein